LEHNGHFQESTIEIELLTYLTKKKRKEDLCFEENRWKIVTEEKY
jgi:hypothetical protein